MKRYFSKYSLRNKLLLAFVGLAIIPTLFMGAFLFVRLQQDTVRTVYHSLQSGLEQSCDALGRSLDELSMQNGEQETVLNSVKALGFVKEIQEQAPQDNSIAIYRQIGAKSYYILLDEEYLKEFFSQNLNGVGYTILCKDRSALVCMESTAKEAGQNGYITVSSQLFQSDIFVVQFLDQKNELGRMSYWVDVATRTCLIGIVISICAACGMSYKFSYRVDNLLKEMSRVRNGDFSEITPVEGEDEISRLSRSFHNLTAELDTVINRNLKLKISEREARIKVLQNQISPHFLYNALDSINWNLIERGDWETSKILLALSSMLRYSIEDSDDMVCVEEEIRQVENYLIIQKSRFSDRFDYTIEADERVKSILVPKMILQPIVENALGHGLECAQGGHLSIKALTRDFGFEIIVEDDGVGIEKEKLEKLMQKIRQSSQIRDEEAFHIGLANVNSRLKYVYRNDSGLYIESEPNCYTRVRLVIDLGGAPE